MKSYTMNPASIIRLIKGTPKSGDPINIVEYNPEGFPTRIVYNIIGDTTEELIVAYGPNDGPIINGIEYKSHANVFELIVGITSLVTIVIIFVKYIQSFAPYGPARIVCPNFKIYSRGY